MWTLGRPTPSGRPVSPGTYLVVDRDPRRGRQPRPLAAAEPPRPAGGGLRRQAARATAASPSATSACARPTSPRARATRSSSSSTRGASRGRGRCGASGRASATPSRRKTSARVRLHAPGASRASTCCRCARRRAPTTVPFAVQSAQAPPRPRRPAGHDLAGAQLARRRRRRRCRTCSTAASGPSCSASTPATGCPPASPTRDAPLLAWLDRRRHRYDITTDVALAAEPRPAPGGPPRRHPALRRALAAARPAAAPAPLRARRRHASPPSASTRCAARSRSPRRGRMVDPTPPATTDVFGVRLRPLARLPKPTNLVDGQRRHRLLRAARRAPSAPSRSSRRPSCTAAEAAASAVTEDPQTGRAGHRGPARGQGARAPLRRCPSCRRTSRARANDPQHRSPCCDRTWTLLSR